MNNFYELKDMFDEINFIRTLIEKNIIEERGKKGLVCYKIVDKYWEAIKEFDIEELFS